MGQSMETKLTPLELLGPRIEGPHSRQVQIHWECSLYFKLQSGKEVCAEICMFRFCTQTVQLEREAGPGRKGVLTTALPRGPILVLEVNY